MKTFIVNEYKELKDSDVYDLRTETCKDCIGCWTCWLKTPGRCVHHDLDAYYQSLLQADTFLFYLRPSHDFVSGRVKTLFDRMIVLGLPFIRYDSGESMHLMRYRKNPSVIVRYLDEFSDAQARSLFVEYLQRVFFQFGMEVIEINADGGQVS